MYTPTQTTPVGFRTQRGHLDYVEEHSYPVGTTTMTTTPTTVTICPAGNAQNQENEHDKARRKAKEEERDKGAEAKWQLYKNRWMRMQIVADAEMNEVEENANHGIRAIIEEKNRVRTASWLAGAGSSKDAAPQQMTAKQDAITAVQQQTAFRLRAEASTPEAATTEKNSRNGRRHRKEPPSSPSQESC